MKKHQEAIDQYLDQFAADCDRWIMVSYSYSNMGSYHLMEGDKKLKSIDFRFSNNHMEWGKTKGTGLWSDANTIMYSIVTQWDELLLDLKQWVETG